MITASFMQRIYRLPGVDADGNPHPRVLHRSKITEVGFYDSFGDFVAGLLTSGVYPSLPTNKEDAFGWTPTLFQPAEDDRDNGVIGIRKGMFAADTVSLFIADLDNQFPDRTMITIDDVAATLNDLGLSHFLYTSFSHKPDRHKVRIVCPISRDMTPDEAFKVFTWFNYAFDYQLDGSVYDPGDFLYGPPINSHLTVQLDGAPLDVDAFLSMADALPDEAKTFVVRREASEYRAATVEEVAIAKAAWANTTETDGVSIHNPAYFRPDWLKLLADRYQQGSRHQTSKALLSKAWVMSGRTLTRSDLQTLQREMDFEYGLYLSRTYGSAILADDVKFAMTAAGSSAAPSTPITTGQSAAPRNHRASAFTTKLQKKYFQ